jgi:hypothetical protein
MSHCISRSLQYLDKAEHEFALPGPFLDKAEHEFALPGPFLDKAEHEFALPGHYLDNPWTWDSAEPVPDL